MRAIDAIIRVRESNGKVRIKVRTSFLSRAKTSLMRTAPVRSARILKP